MKNSMNLPLKSMPADSLSSISDPEFRERYKERLAVVDAADTVSHKLSVLCVLLDSNEFEKLDSETLSYAHGFIYDTLQECIDLLRGSKEV